MAVVVVMMMLVVLVGMFTVPFAPPLVVSMNPMVVIAIARHPHPLESVIPIARTIVIRAIADID